MRQRERSARAWQAIFWGACLFTAIQVGSGLVLEVGPIELTDAEYGQRERLLLQRLAERPDRPLVLALGSSRTNLGLQARRMSESLDNPPATVFNFGLTGAGPMTYQVALRRLQAHGIRPDILLVEVLPPLFNEPSGPEFEATWLKGNHLRLGEVASVAPRHVLAKRMLTDWARSRLLLTDQKRLLVRRGFGLELPGDITLPLPEDGHGWLGQDLRWVPPSRRPGLYAHAKCQYSKTFGDFHPAAVPAHILHEVLADCRRQRIPTALYLMPEASSFRAFYPPQQTQDFDAFLAALAREEGVPLIDARRWVPDNGFWDGHHLLPKGATVFTDRFEREAIRPLLKSRLADSLAVAR